MSQLSQTINEDTQQDIKGQSEAFVSEELVNIFRNDPYGQKLGFKLLHVKPGYALANAVVTDETLNFAGAPHGGFLFSLADYALAAASNSHGRLTVGMTVSIQFFAKANIGDELYAEAMESHLANRTGFYEIIIRTDSKKIAQCIGTVHRFDSQVEIE